MSAGPDHARAEGISGLLGSTRLVARRAGSHAGVLVTAMLTAVVVATLLVSATVLAPGVAETGFRDTLIDAGAAEQDVVASTALDVESWPETDASVRSAAGEAPGLVGDVTAAAWTTAFATPGLGEGARVIVGTLEDPADQAQLSEGRWPEAGVDPLEVAVHADALEGLGATVGESIALVALVGGSGTTTATVVGAYKPDEPDDEVWRGYGVGVRPGDGNLVSLLGPVLADRDDLLTRIRPGSTTAAWTISVDTDALNLGNARERARASRTLAEDLRDAPIAEGNQMSVRGDASVLIERALTAATSVRAVLLVVVTMLAVLGVWALAFTARLVAGRRAAATALLRARGVDPGRLLRWSVLGGLLPAVAVAAAAPPLADLALSPLRDRAVLAEAASTRAMSTTGWLVAAAAAAGWLAMLVLADLHAGRSITGVSVERARPPRRAAIQRAGLDVLVVALGLLGLQQLRRPAGESPEIVLVIAPALVVLAGTVVLVRALPWVGRAASWLAVRRRGVPAMLGAFELSRRPLRHAAAASLVVLALAVSVFAATTQATWSTFRSDTVDLAEPADVRVRADVEFGELMEADERDAVVSALTQRMAGLPGVEAAMPVVTREFADEEARVDVIGLDGATAARIMRWDERHSEAPVDELLSTIFDAGTGTIRALVTHAFADRLGLAVGDETVLRLADAGPDAGEQSRTGQGVRITVAGLVDAVPSASGPQGVLVDQRLLRAALAEAPPNEWWLATSDGGRAAADAARDLTEVTAASTHAQAADEARDDPSAAGVLAGLAAGLAFAAVFVLIGVVVHAVTSYRSRTSEYAVLRAVGLAARGSVGTVVVEQGLLLVFATVAGLGLGLVVAWLVVPHTVGGLAGLPEIPPLQLTYPWVVLGSLAAAIAFLLVAVVVVASAGVRRIDVPAVLRAGEDT